MKRANRTQKTGKESRDMLRQRFEAQTDIEIGTLQSNWKHYAEWIERLSVRKINDELVLENEMLRNRMQEAMNTLEAGISGRPLALKKRVSGRKPGRTICVK